MRGSESADTNNLTGVWDGLYRQPGRKQHVPFTATLIDTGSLISGSTHEPCNVPDCPIKTHYAAISGELAAQAITFIKSYEPSGYGYDVVNYAGTLNADGTEIAGSWSIPRSGLSGEFLMIRGQRKTVAAMRETERTASN